MSKRVPVYLSEAELMEILSCINFKLSHDFDVSHSLLTKLEETLDTFKEETTWLNEVKK